MNLTRAELLMLLLAAPGPHGANHSAVQGTTRLQKLIFLLENEAGLKATSGPDYDFTAYKFGPVSKELYDDLEKLENLGFVEYNPISKPSEIELGEYSLSFDDLMGEEEQESKDSFEEKQYRISEKGIEWLKQRINLSENTEALDKIRRVKGKYGGLSLQDLLHHVYTRYPEMTVASEIRDRVLGNR